MRRLLQDAAPLLPARSSPAASAKASSSKAPAPPRPQKKAASSASKTKAKAKTKDDKSKDKAKAPTPTNDDPSDNEGDTSNSERVPPKTPLPPRGPSSRLEFLEAAWTHRNVDTPPGGKSSCASL